MLRVLILLIALGAAGTAAWLALAMQSSDAPAAAIAAPAPQVRTVEVLVASADIGQGQSLDPANLRWQAWPEDAANPGFISRSARVDAIETLSGSAVRSRFVAGEPIMEEKLARSGSGLLATVLPSGKRAIAIRVSAENTAGGFIVPNDQVDVIHTVTQQGQGEGQMEGVSHTILRNIRVLAIDQEADESKDQTVVIGKTATLQLDPDQAEIVTGAQASGLLSLSLRSIADSDENSVMGEQKSASVRILRAGHTEIVKIQ
jgi:pilus assembly protein CpaB